MSSVARIERKIQRGRGKAGSKLGQFFNVYRLNSKSSGQLVQLSNLVLLDFQCMMKAFNSVADTEVNWMIKVPRFQGTCDNSKLQVGDVLVETGFENDGSVFTYAYTRPQRKSVFIHTPVAAALTRAENNPTGIDSGLVPASETMKQYELMLVLQDGIYSFQRSGSPAAVYIGLQTQERAGEYPSTGAAGGPKDVRLATDTKRAVWHVYHGLLPGIEITRNDLYSGQNGDRYYARNAFSQFVGLQGWQIITEDVRV